MRLHDLRPAEGSRKERTRVGRGIAAGKGKTAGRGTKGQKARAGGGIPAWFEGGQTPLHQRIPKLRGFKNRFKIEYEIVNIGAIAAAVERGAFEQEADDSKAKGKAKAGAQITVNQDLLRAVGLVRSLNKPLKILGTGELSTALFVVADAFTASARTKIEAAGGSVNVLEVPTAPLKAIGLETGEERTAPEQSRGAQAASAQEAKARAGRAEVAEAAEAEADAKAAAPKKSRGKAEAAASEDDAAASDAGQPETPTAEAESATAEAETPSAEAETPTAEAEAPTAEADAPTAEAEPPTADADADAASPSTDEAETASGDDT
jgi:large subunit ribosomal protein L15